MSLDSESVTFAGSGLVFLNFYGTGVTPAYRNAAIVAENFLQSHFSNATTISVDFEFSPLSAGTSGQNVGEEVDVSYATLASALRSHATTADDLLAVAGLPASDPSNGVGFAIPTSEARILGLATQTNDIDIDITLNSNLSWTFGQDAAGVIEHEMTEGAFGRIASLGFSGTRWEPLDLFRFNASGQRDYTGGSDGVTTYFGVDSGHLSNLAYHSAISATGVNDGEDLGDWDSTIGDAFGPGGPGSPGVVNATDLRILDVLGWTPGSAAAPAADDFANSLTDTTHPFGQITPGSTASGALQTAGDRDWFAVQLKAGDSYTISLLGHTAGDGTLADPYLRLHDSSGALLAQDDDIVDGSNPDSSLVFVAPTAGTYYVEAGAYLDAYAGTYQVTVTDTGGTPGATDGNDLLIGGAAGATLMGGLGNDTIEGGAASNYLRGNEGDDSIQGGSGFDDINGNQGNDTIAGGPGDDYVVGGKDNDSQSGDAGNDIVWGNLGDDTLSGGDGDDQVRGGQGDDSISGGAGNDYISGDRGNDTESGGPGADRFHGSQDAGIDKVLDFNLAEGDRVMLDPGTTYTLSQVGADTVIDMGGSNEMILVGVQLSTLTPGWIFESF